MSATIGLAYPGCHWYGSRRTLGATANIAELSLVRDVLLAMLFVLWTAWWISILVVFEHQTQTAATTPLS